MTSRCSVLGGRCLVLKNFQDHSTTSEKLYGHGLVLRHRERKVPMRPVSGITPNNWCALFGQRKTNKGARSSKISFSSPNLPLWSKPRSKNNNKETNNKKQTFSPFSLLQQKNYTLSIITRLNFVLWAFTFSKHKNLQHILCYKKAYKYTMPFQVFPFKEKKKEIFVKTKRSLDGILHCSFQQQLRAIKASY